MRVDTKRLTDLARIESEKQVIDPEFRADVDRDIVEMGEDAFVSFMAAKAFMDLLESSMKTYAQLGRGAVATHGALPARIAERVAEKAIEVFSDHSESLKEAHVDRMPLSVEGWECLLIWAESKDPD